MLIPKIIDNTEILVRFIFIDNFKKKVLDETRLNTQDIFLDTRLFGISLQRSLYTNENKCKEFASSILNKQYAGFVLFYKNDFISTVEDYQIERGIFESVIEFTPLDENNQYLVDRDNSNVEDEGNPSHSDIIYVNPAISAGEANPNTSLRLFSKKLMTKCKVVIDENFESSEFNLGLFSDLVAS